MIRLERLPLPCPVNRLHMPVRMGNRARLVVSPEATKRRHRFVAEVWRQLGGRPTPMKGGVMVSGHFYYAKASHIPDADAYTKHLLDCLVHAGLIEDDRQVPVSPPIERMGHEFPGHITIEIWPIQDTES